MASAAERRLNALLRDEEYGPKLARLNRADERIILDLIDQNKGREARKRLVELDENRRVKRTVRDRAKAYSKLSNREKRQQWKKAQPKDHEREFWKLYKQYRGL